MTEKWKAIRGYEGMYEISNQGRVRSLSRYRENHRAVQHVPEIILKEYIGRWGYALVKLCSNGNAKEMKVHRLVAEAFLNTPEKDQVNHKDGNKLNNCVENLEWCTGSENMQHAYDNGLHSLAHPVILEEYGIIFPSMASAAKFVDGKQSGIYRCIVGNGDGTYDASETPLGTQKPIGLIKKYNVFKADDNSAVDDCFVLRPDKDPTAAIALRAYADATENQELALDILRWLLDIKAKATAGD